MGNFGRATAILLSIAAVTSAAATPGNTDSVPAHHVKCTWNKRVGTPWGVNSTTVQGYVEVTCSGNLSKGNTEAQLQIFRDGEWKNHGNPVVSHNTTKIIHVNAKAPKRIGEWRYRTKGTHFGQHGNVSKLPAFYSPVRMSWRRG